MSCNMLIMFSDLTTIKVVDFNIKQYNYSSFRKLKKLDIS